MVLGTKFLHRFTSDELVAISTSADPIVHNYVAALSISMLQDLDLTQPIFADGMNYLVSVGLITADRANTIMTSDLPANITTQQGIT